MSSADLHVPGHGECRSPLRRDAALDGSGRVRSVLAGLASGPPASVRISRWQSQQFLGGAERIRRIGCRQWRAALRAVRRLAYRGRLRALRARHRPRVIRPRPPRPVVSDRVSAPRERYGILLLQWPARANQERRGGADACPAGCVGSDRRGALSAISAHGARLRRDWRDRSTIRRAVDVRGAPAALGPLPESDIGAHDDGAGAPIWSRLMGGLRGAPHRAWHAAGGGRELAARQPRTHLLPDAYLGLSGRSRRP